MVKRISNALNRKNSVTGASVILIITLFLSNVLGMIRDHFLTQKIPTDLLSVYYAAFRIPDFIFNILILGAITSAFIPIFTTLISQKKEKEAWNVASSVINLALLFLLVISVILLFLMPLLVPLFVPGFDVEKQNEVVKLARIMLLSPIFFGLSYIIGGILNSFKRFLVYALAPLIYNLTIIGGTLLFADKYSVVAVSIAVVCGAFLHFLIQLPVAIKLGFKYQFKIFFSHWGVRRIGILMLPRSLALGMNQIMLLVFTAIASSLGGYSVAVYTLADNIQTMPMVVFGTSFATAVFPSLSESVSQDNLTSFANQIQKVMRTVLFFLVPMTAILILLRTEIIRLILGSGFFGWEQTIATANVLGILSLSIVFTGLSALFSRGFYALHNTKTPMIITLINVILSVVLGKILSVSYGVSGLAMGFSIGAFFGILIYYFALRRKIKFENEIQILIFLVKVLAASFLMAFLLQETKILIGYFVDMQRFWGVALKTLVSLTVGVGVYLLCCFIFGLEEIKAIKQVFAKYSGNGRTITSEEDIDQ